tara:strand:+ start:275 stop:715 length:441 start_codon:yes stop_codon:yes gene_type:complete
MLNQFQEELKKAMKNGNKATIIGLRNIIGKIKATQIDKGKILEDDEIITILKSAAKQLKESINQYKKGGREDLANKELFELSLIEQYLPEQMHEDQIIIIVKNIIKTLNAKSMQDLGQVMGATMKKIAGSADGKLVQKIAQRELNK